MSILILKFNKSKIQTIKNENENEIINIYFLNKLFI